MQKKKKEPHFCGSLHLLKSFEVVNYVLNSGEFADVGIVNGNSEFVLAEHNEVCKLNRVNSKVSGKLGIGLNVLGIDLELVNEESL